MSGEGTVTDLSKRGWKATVASTQTVRRGTYLALHLSLPDQAPPMKVSSAAVRWSREGEFGVEFLFMESGEEERLDQFLQTLETGSSP